MHNQLENSDHDKQAFNQLENSDNENLALSNQNHSIVEPIGSNEEYNGSHQLNDDQNPPNV